MDPGREFSPGPMIYTARPRCMYGTALLLKKKSVFNCPGPFLHSSTSLPLQPRLSLPPLLTSPWALHLRNKNSFPFPRESNSVSWLLFRTLLWGLQLHIQKCSQDAGLSMMALFPTGSGTLAFTVAISLLQNLPKIFYNQENYALGNNGKTTKTECHENLSILNSF